METIAGEILQQALAWLPRLGTGIFLFLLFWLAALGTRRWLARAFEKTGLAADVANLIGRTAKIGLLLFGAVTALGTLGIDVSALVAGLGLSGFALGFALKDTISNLLAGALLLIYRPFSVDDRIKVAVYEGLVESIDLRYTTLKGEAVTYLVPNSTLFTNPITLLDREG